MRQPLSLVSQWGLERPTDLEQKLLNLGAPFWGLCFYFLSACSPFTSHLMLSRVLGNGLKESEEEFVLQKGSKESSVGPVLNKIIKTDKSIPLPQGWFPRVGPPPPPGKKRNQENPGWQNWLPWSVIPQGLSPSRGNLASPTFDFIKETGIYI